MTAPRIILLPNQLVYTRVSQTKTLNTYINKYHGRCGVLIRDSYPDVRLFHSLWRGDLPSRWLQLLQWSLVSLQGVPDRVCYRTNAVHELSRPLVHSYWQTCVTILNFHSSMNFDGFHRFTTLHYLKNGWQNAVIFWCMFQAGLPSLHYYCAVVLHSCIALPPVGRSSNHEYQCFQLTR